MSTYNPGTTFIDVLIMVFYYKVVWLYIKLELYIK